MNMLNGSQLHLLLNHWPVIVPFIATVLLFLGIIIKSVAVKNVGLALIVFGGVAAIPTYLTGEPAEHVVKNYPGISRDLIHQHERAAKYSLIFLEIVAALGLGLLVVAKFTNIHFSFYLFLCVLSFLSFVHVARTAHFGGEIRHEEIRGE
jgi:hypothetical protein